MCYERNYMYMFISNHNHIIYELYPISLVNSKIKRLAKGRGFI